MTLFKRHGSGIRSYLGMLSHLLYPNLCMHCGRELIDKSPYLCYVCFSEIEQISWREDAVHHLIQQMIYRPSVHSTCVLFSFQTETPVQTLLHELKYKFNRSSGHYFGRLLGKKHADKHSKPKFTAILPVPIHHRKRFDRGYNQSEVIANGISEIIAVPVVTDLLVKKRNTVSQTKLSKEARKNNSKDVFVVSDKIKNYVSIALVDDVITTGSTLSAICQKLLEKNANIQITIFTLAIASKE